MIIYLVLCEDKPEDDKEIFSFKDVFDAKQFMDKTITRKFRG